MEVATENPNPDTSDLIERGWSKLPASYRPPASAPGLEEARAYCQRLAESHYENFHVASWFLPKKFRPHFHGLYAYCRIADDLGDEVGDAPASLALLDYWNRELDACYAGRAHHPVFVVLRETIRATSLPKQPLADLLSAFRQDQVVTRYATLDDLLDYCRRSANPVGRLVLHLCGEADAERFRLSDATCTALQLANFWQDVAGDYARGRVYLPQADLERFGLSSEVIAGGVATPAFRDLIRHEVEVTRRLFDQGLPLIGLVARDLAVDLDLFSRGGLAILRAIEQQDYDVLSSRPALSKRAKVALAARAVGGQAWPALRLLSNRPTMVSPAAPSNSVLQRAYAECVDVARTQAKNFYYAFAALNEPRRHAICSIYAFMRRADDLADDAGRPIEERRSRLAAWTEAWRAASAGAATADPVFLAVRDTTQRFSIPLNLLDELIAGVARDLAPAGAPLTYATAAELHRYCYQVASVVGLVCIRIFGYQDPRAEQLAEDTGIAFQLTNILRDVAEDASQNRVYLPLEDLEAHGVSVDTILRRTARRPPTEAERAVLLRIATRAEQYYRSARELLPLIDRESRPALWVLITIYSRLLQRIQRANYDVFSRRVRVPTLEKVGILAASRAAGAWGRLWPRGA